MSHDLEQTLPVTISRRGEVIIVRWHTRPVGGQREAVNSRFIGRAVEHQLPD